ncbi:MAG: FkbM family methyltransferase [Candidatus Paceibacteria bacterium]
MHKKTTISQQTQFTISIDNYCSLTGFYPEIIKIDVEGAELDVLKGSKEVLNKNKLNTIFLELHPMFFKESKKETILKQINELLNSFQFYKFSHHRNKNKNSLEKINSLTEIKKNRMILCKR